MANQQGRPRYTPNKLIAMLLFLEDSDIKEIVKSVSCSVSALYAKLNGTRRMTKDTAKELGEYFGVPAATFFANSRKFHSALEEFVIDYCNKLEED